MFLEVYENHWGSQWIHIKHKWIAYFEEPNRNKGSTILEEEAEVIAKRTWDKIC